MPTEDPTTTMNISLPGSLRAFVEARVADEGYTSASEFVRELIREARQKHGAREHLEQLLVEGINSGPATDWTDEDWSALRMRVGERLDTRNRTC